MLLKNHNGFILLDLLLSLSCIILFISFLVPSVKELIQVQDEHHQLLAVDELLNNLLKEHLYKESLDSVEDPIQYKGNMYFFTFQEVNPNVLLTCLNWTNHKNEKESYCQYVPT